MTIHFPWGSLLRGVLGHDEAALAGVAALLAPGASAHVLFSVTARDGVPEPSAQLGAVYAAAGLQLAEAPRDGRGDRCVRLDVGQEAAGRLRAARD